jgi:hypothetical protein
MIAPDLDSAANPKFAYVAKSSEANFGFKSGTIG